MNLPMQEMKFNKRANKHQFCVRAVRNSHGVFRYYMRCNGKIYIWCNNGGWSPLRRVTNYGPLKAWELRVFGVKLGSKGEILK